jgi:hypothetical protein
MSNSALRLVAGFILIFAVEQIHAAHTKSFQVGDCEKMVLGRKGDTARTKVREWLADFNFIDLELLRVGVAEENLIEDHIYDDTEDDQASTKYKIPILDQNLPLSKLELFAFGISPDRVVSVSDVRFSLKSKSADELVLTSYNGAEKIGEVTLSTNSLRIGFQNRIQFYQSYWKAEGFETDVETFFGDYGYVLLPAGRFAFVFPLIAADKPPMASEYFEMTIFSMRDCPGREAFLMKDLLFPDKGQPSGAKNICLDPLGLKIALPVKDEE